MSGRLGMTGNMASRGDKEFGKAQGNKSFMVFQGAGGTRARLKRPAAGRRFREMAHPAAGLPPQNVEGWARRFEDPILQAPGPIARSARSSFTMERMGVGRAGKAPLGRMKAPSATVESQRGVARRGGIVRKVDTTMSEREAARLARQYDTRGPLPKTLSREQKMKAYEARYIATGGKKGEKWKRRADAAEGVRNIGLAGATVSAAGLLASRGRRTGPVMARHKVTRKLTPHRLETAALVSGGAGGGAELYGEHARARRASYANTPAGVAGSALSRMQAYTPGRKS